jgi:Cu+-exporting ATPase
MGGTPACGNTPGIATLKLPDLDGDTVCLCDYIGKRPVAMLVAGRDSASVRALGLFRQAQAGVKSELRSVKSEGGERAGEAGESVVFIAAFVAKPKAVKALLGPADSSLVVLVDTGRKVMQALGLEFLPAMVFFNAAGKQVKSLMTPTRETVAEGLAAAVAKPEEFTDPVCGMKVTKDGAAGSAEYQGKTYYFCSAACRQAFSENPGKYVGE